jgi:hypothetical protein
LGTNRKSLYLLKEAAGRKIGGFSFVV